MLLPNDCSQKQIVSFKQNKVKDGKVHSLLLFSSSCRCPKMVFAVQAKPFSIWNSLNMGNRGYLGLFMNQTLPFPKTGKIWTSSTHSVDTQPGAYQMCSNMIKLQLEWCVNVLWDVTCYPATWQTFLHHSSSCHLLCTLIWIGNVSHNTLVTLL